MSFKVATTSVSCPGSCRGVCKSHVRPVLDESSQDVHTSFGSRYEHRRLLASPAWEVDIRTGSHESKGSRFLSTFDCLIQWCRLFSANTSLAAPLSNNSSTIAVLPRLTATWRGVSHFESLSFSGAPLSTRSLTTSPWPPRTAA